MASNRDGNGARERLQEYLDFFSIDQIDHMLMWLWTQGYHVVPLPQGEGSGEDEDELPDAALMAPEGATVYPINLFRRRPHP